jgi:DNA-binding transcriptional MerR regulator
MKKRTPLNFSLEEVAKYSESKEQLREALNESLLQEELHDLEKQVEKLEKKLELAEETRDKSVDLNREIINGLKKFTTFKDLKAFITEKYEDSGVEI